MRLSVILLGTLALAGAHLSWASPTGSITGFVKDPSGAFIVGAKITITNAASNARLTALTGASGAYFFPQLPPAMYSLLPNHPGTQWRLRSRHRPLPFGLPIPNRLPRLSIS